MPDYAFGASLYLSLFFFGARLLSGVKHPFPSSPPFFSHGQCRWQTTTNTIQAVAARKLAGFCCDLPMFNALCFFFSNRPEFKRKFYWELTTFPREFQAFLRALEEKAQTSMAGGVYSGLLPSPLSFPSVVATINRCRGKQEDPRWARAFFFFFLGTSAGGKSNGKVVADYYKLIVPLPFFPFFLW